MTSPLVAIVLLLGTEFCFLVTFVTQPTTARCPCIGTEQTILLTGIRRNGDFTCWTPGRGVEARTAKGVLRERIIAPPLPVGDSTIYCHPNLEPIVRTDGVTVGCQPKGY